MVKQNLLDRTTSKSVGLIEVSEDKKVFTAFLMKLSFEQNTATSIQPNLDLNTTKKNLFFVMLMDVLLKQVHGRHGSLGALDFAVQNPRD